MHKETQSPRNLFPAAFLGMPYAHRNLTRDTVFFAMMSVIKYELGGTGFVSLEYIFYLLQFLNDFLILT